MKLITEVIESVSAEIIAESTEAKKTYKISAPFIHCNEANRNGRVYSKEHLMPEVSRYIKEYVDTKRALGELCHPDGPVINPDRVSHLITKLEWKDNLCMGEAIILDTSTGNTLRSFMDAGVSFGVSTRGLGSIKENNGLRYVQPDFRLITVDAVLDPSGLQCWAESLLEGKNWIYVDGIGWTEQLAEKAIKSVKSAKAKDVEPLALKIFENYLNRL